MAPEHVASTIAQIALRDDYDPVVFLFCLNAIFLSVVINVVNYGMEKDEETGMLKMPEGGFPAVLDNTKRGMVEYMMAVPKQFKEIYEGSNPALESAIEELEDAKMAAYAARGTDAAEATAMRFMETTAKVRGPRAVADLRAAQPGTPVQHRVTVPSRGGNYRMISSFYTTVGYVLASYRARFTNASYENTSSAAEPERQVSRGALPRECDQGRRLAERPDDALRPVVRRRQHR